MRITLAVVGDATDPSTFSGTPYYALTAAQRCGREFVGLKLDTNAAAWKRRRLYWNAMRFVTTGHWGGYQYSKAFLTSLWGQNKPNPNDVLVNFFQLYPESILERHLGGVFFYLDQTLHQLFETYHGGKQLPTDVIADAISREQHQYQQANAILVQSRYAASSVRDDYGISSEKVHVVIPGANIDIDALNDWGVNARPGQDQLPLRLVFVGKDWKRKGLDRLISAFHIARNNGADTSLTIIGVSPMDLPRHLRSADAVNWAGFIDKRYEVDKFIDLVSSCHVGCLLSHAEAGGMSLREFARLGLITLAPDVGGSPEYVVPGASYLVAPNASDEEIAAIIYRLATDKDLLASQRATAWAARHSASWEQAISELTAHIEGACQ